MKKSKKTTAKKFAKKPVVAKTKISSDASLKKKKKKKSAKKPKKEPVTLPEISETFGASNKDILELEKIKKTYWTDQTEEAVKEYLRHDFNYYKTRIEMYIKKRKKEDGIDAEHTLNLTPADTVYITRMQERLDFTNTEEHVKIKNEIYNESIQHPFDKLVENIIFTYRLFRDGVDVETIHNDGVSFLFEKLCHFDPEVHARSFSYYGTIVKHYLQNKKKQADDTIYTYVNYDSNSEESDSENTEEIDAEHPLDLSQDLFNYVISSMEDDMKAGKLSINELKVADSILKIMKSHEIIGVYNRNQIYALIREATGIPNKEITYALSRFREYYAILRKRFMEEKGKIH